MKGKRDGVERPTPLVFCERGRKPRTESDQIGLCVILFAPLVVEYAGERGRGEVGGVLESEREPREEEED
jgi:hypothetical protein